LPCVPRAAAAAAASGPSLSAPPQQLARRVAGLQRGRALLAPAAARRPTRLLRRVLARPLAPAARLAAGPSSLVGEMPLRREGIYFYIVSLLRGKFPIVFGSSVGRLFGDAQCRFTMQNGYAWRVGSSVEEWHSQLRGNRQFKSESIHVLPIHRKRRRDRIKQSPMAVVQPLRRGLLPLLFVLLVVLRPQSCAASGVGEPAEFEIPRDGTVVELDESNFDAALRSADYLFVDFYAPWCGHCKRLAPQLDEAAPVLAGLATPIVIAKVNADKYKNLRSKYEIDGFPTLMFFDHGVPSEYTGSRKADLLIENLKKLVAPAVSVLKSDAAIKGFVEAAGVGFPLFIGFGVEESLIAEYGAKYKKKAWFSVAKDFSEDMMVLYDFDKAPALISHNPKYNEQSVFYGPFEGTFLEDFIRQSLLPLTVPINRETVKLLDDDDRKVVLTILDDETDENSPQLIKVLRSAASANHDLIFGYVGVKQWEEFTETFDVSKSSRQPKMIVWDRDEEYEVVEGSEQLEEGDYGSQISQFLEGYRAGRTIKKKVGRGFPTLLGVNALYILILLVAVLLVMMYFAGQGEENIRPRAHAD
ncbi:hypothetical protein EJB05_21324, partial [Eragrostis curvula]